MHPLHSKVLFLRLAMAIRPQRLHTWILAHLSYKYKSTPVGVGYLEKLLSEELSGPVRNLTISLHLTEPAEVEIIAD